jgi:hypothetical protein
LLASADFRALSSALLVAAALCGLGACTDGTYPEYFAQRYVIDVDSLSVSPSLAAGDTLEARFWGYVGPNSCHDFEGFEVEHHPHHVELTLWTKYFRRTGTVCNEELVFLDGESYRYGPLSAGFFSLLIHQSDGSTLTVTVPVAENGPR